MAQIKAQNITDNVVEMMAGRLKKLSPQTARLLQRAACIGSEFDLQTLSLICQTSVAALLHRLSEALREDLLVPQDDFYL